MKRRPGTRSKMACVLACAAWALCMQGADWCRKLDLPQMVATNTDNHQTAFTVSIDATETTTGARQSSTESKTVFISAHIISDFSRAEGKTRDEGLSKRANGSPISGET